MNTDPIADFLTRIRNANSAGLRTVVIPSSKIKKEITKILFDQGFVLNYQFINDTTQGSIKIALKYNQITKEPVIKKIERVSKPGLRRYSSSSELPRVLNGLGVNIVSTSKGLMTGKKAKKEISGSTKFSLNIFRRNDFLFCSLDCKKNDSTLIMTSNLL